MSSFILDNCKETFSAFSVGFDAGDGPVKRRHQAFATFSSHISSMWHVLQLKLAVSDPESETKKTAGP